MPCPPLLPALLCTFVLAACAQAGPPPLHAGEWQVANGAPGQPSVAYQLCMKTGTAEDLKLLLPRVQGSAACPAPVLGGQGAELLWDLACPAAQLAVHARYTVTAQRVDGRVEVTSGSPPQQRVDHISATYTGACAAP